MGLDLAEFTLAVEDAFGLHLPDAVAVEILTPGELVDYLLARVTPAAHPHCLEQRAFYLVRRAGMQVLAHPRGAFGPSVPWTQLLPRGRRRRTWRLLQHATGTSKWPAMWFGRVEPRAATVGGTARYLATYVPGQLRPPVAQWARADVEQIIRRLMLEELGVAEFGWNQQFVRDLKLN